MAFVVATGIELGTADSYVSVAAVDNYFDAMQDEAWGLVSDDKKEWLLRRASIFIDRRYRWIDPTSYTSVPRALEIATFELAKSWSVSNTVVEQQGLKRVAVGPIAVEYAGSSTTAAVPDQIYTFIDQMVSGIGSPRVSSTVTGGWGSIAVSRT